MRKKKNKNKPRLRKTNHTLEEFYLLCSEYNFCCVICGAEFCFSELTRDHILPTSKGGCDYIWNIQPACESCNSEKGRLYRDYRPFIPSWVSSKYKSFCKNNRKLT